jgi:hypothetical protein
MPVLHIERLVKDIESELRTYDTGTSFHAVIDQSIEYIDFESVALGKIVG